MRLGEFDPPSSNPYRQIPRSVIESPEHMALNQDMAEASIVLLENSAGGLPYTAEGARQRVALLGPFADSRALMYGKYAPHGVEGSTSTVLDAFQRTLGADHVAYGPGCPDNFCRQLDTANVTAAVEGATAVVVCLGTGYTLESEEKDRLNLALPGQQLDLLDVALEAASAAGVNITLIVFTAGPVDLSTVANGARPGIGAILQAIYPGQRSGAALASLLLEQRSPSGRLPFTWPRSGGKLAPLSDYNITAARMTYRYGQKDVLWPFGHGLSYTSFSYSGLRTASAVVKTCDTIVLTVHVSNTGGMAANESIQAYVQWRDVNPHVDTPVLQLAALARVALAPGETKEVGLEVSVRQYAVVSEPQCLPPHSSVNYPNATILASGTGVASVGACCAECLKYGDECEAYTYVAQENGLCVLKAGRSQAVAHVGATSGDVTPVWVARPATLMVRCGGGIQGRAGGQHGWKRGRIKRAAVVHFWHGQRQ